MWWRRKREAELKREVESHLELEAEDQNGDRHKARKAFGNATLVQEDTRAVWGSTTLEQLAQDIRYAGRTLLKKRAFTFIAIASLALGIGASTAIFAVVNGVLLRPLPYTEPERLVRLWETNPKRSITANVVNAWNFLDWREHTSSFEAIAAMQPFSVSLTGQGEPVSVPAMQVSASFFSILGVQPSLGQGFVAEDERPSENWQVILSHNLWQSQFGGDPAVLGKPISAGTVVGVLPPGFSFPGVRADIWVPLRIDRSPPWARGRSFTTVARLKAGVTMEQAGADVVRVARQSAEERPANNLDWSAEVVPLLEDTTKGVRTSLFVLLGAVGFLLLIACANVANLFLIRGAERSREVALRETLGASRLRIFRQFLTESLLVSLTAAAAGVAAAHFGLRGLLAMLPQNAALPRADSVGLDTRVLAVALVLSVTTAVVFSLAPLREAHGADLQKTFRFRAGIASRVFRRFFVSAQVAMALVLLAGAGLMARSFARLMSVDPGFTTERILAIDLFTAPGRFSENRVRSEYFDTILREARTVPGVEGASLIQYLPLTQALARSCFTPPRDPLPPPAAQPSAQIMVVGSGHLKTMGIPLYGGREFTEQDRFGAPGVILVNRLFAQQNFPGENAVGKKLYVCWGQLANPVEIVGVTGDSRQAQLGTDPVPSIFVANAQAPGYFATILLRTPGEPSQIARPVISAIRRANPDQAVGLVRSMEEVVNDSAARPRFYAVLFLVFAGVGLLLAAIGVYGVVSYSVAQQTREIGVRIAVGATRGNIASLVLKEGLLLAAIGLVVGLAGVHAMTRFLRTLLFEITPTDPETLLLVTGLLVTVTALAIAIPLRRATRVDSDGRVAIRVRRSRMFWRRKRERDLERELQAHVDLEAEQNGGDTFAARRATGNRTLIQENTRAAWGWTQCSQIARDLWQGARMMRRRPVFTAVAILSLAIGIGANTAIFSFANAILIRKLPVAGADRLVILRQHNEAFHMENCCIRMNVFPQLRAQDLGFEDMLGVSFEDVLVKDRGQSERLNAEFVTPNLYAMLGVRAAAGRTLNDADDAANAVAVVVISHRLWIERFGAQADTIGRQIEIDGTPFQIVGVSQPGYAGLSLNSPRDLQIPASLLTKLDQGNSFEVVGRLRPGVSEEQALERLNAVGKRLEREAGLRINDKDNFRFADGSQGLESRKEAFSRPVLVLTLLVGVVLLVACANLSALLLVRSVERSQEASMRVALGASRLALFRQFFAESLMLAGVGGTAGWGVALLLVTILSGYLAAQNPTLSTQVQPDATVFIFAAMVTLGAAVLFGTWPAWRAARADPLPAMHGASGGSRRRTPVSRWIISAQVALSLALLFCAGLFTRTLGNLRSIDLGFEPENLIVLQPNLQGTVHQGAGALPFFQEFLRQTEQLPIVRNASLAQISPLSGSRLSYGLTIPGYVPTGDVRPTALWHTVSRGYCRTMGIPLLRGEDLPLELIPGAALPVLVNEQFARKYLSGEAVGKTFSVGTRQVHVIGLVGTTKYVDLVEEPQPIFYLPFEGGRASSPGLLQVRTNGSPEQAIEQLRALLKAIDPSVPINSVTTMEMQIDEILGRERLLAFLSTLLGGVAVALSAIGLYGVLAFSVARRTREIGIRMAIGARRSGVIAMFLKEGGWLVGGGVLLGIPLALACGRAAETLLYGLQPQDTTTMLGATGLLLLIAIAAALIPSWRAARIDPIRALRHE